MTVEYPELPAETLIQFGEIDLAIEEVLRSLDDCLHDMEVDDADRAILIYHLRMAYVQGFKDRAGDG